MVIGRTVLCLSSYAVPWRSLRRPRTCHLSWPGVTRWRRALACRPCAVRCSLARASSEPSWRSLRPATAHSLTRSLFGESTGTFACFIDCFTASRYSSHKLHAQTHIDTQRRLFPHAYTHALTSESNQNEVPASLIVITHIGSCFFLKNQGCPARAGEHRQLPSVSARHCALAGGSGCPHGLDADVP